MDVALLIPGGMHLDSPICGRVSYYASADWRFQASFRRGDSECTYPPRVALVSSAQLTCSSRWKPPECTGSVAVGEAAAAADYPGRSCVSGVYSAVLAPRSTVRGPDLLGEHGVDASVGVPGFGIHWLAVEEYNPKRMVFVSQRGFSPDSGDRSLGIPSLGIQPMWCVWGCPMSGDSFLGVLREPICEGSIGPGSA